nr:MAG TPA: hypothetical protein [Caudoviricetes sp.]
MWIDCMVRPPQYCSYSVLTSRAGCTRTDTALSQIPANHFVCCTSIVAGMPELVHAQFCFSRAAAAKTAFSRCEFRTSTKGAVRNDRISEAVPQI